MLLATPALAQSASVTGKIQTYSPGIAANALGNYVEFQLTNCGNNTPLVSGSAVLLSKAIDFFPDSTGALTAAANGGVTPSLYGNDVINCGGAFTSRYSIRYYVGGVAQGPTKFYFIPSTAPFNLTTATPIGLQPPLNPPYPNLTTCAPGSYTNGLNPDLSVKCLNLPSGASNAVVTNPTGTQEILGQLLQLDGPFTAQNINSVVIAGQYASLNAASSACPIVGGCTIEVNNTVTLSGNLTLPSTTTLKFNQPGSLNLAGFTLTTGPVEASAIPIFTSGIVNLSSQVANAPAEWFGAVGNGSTNDFASLQAAVNALSTGHVVLQAKKYSIGTNTISINKSNVCFSGVTSGIPNSAQYPAPSASQILSTSATADILDISGTSTSANITYNDCRNFTLARSQSPGVNAAGLRLSFSYGATIDGVTSMDSTSGFVFKGVGSQGTGYIQNSAASWGYNGFTETSGSLAGFQIDSTSGIASPSLRIRNSFVVANTPLASTGVVTFGLLSNGSAMNDLMVDHLETAWVNYGQFLQASLTTSPSTDIHILNSINDNCITTCIYIQNVGGSVEVSGGWDFRQSSTSPVIDIRTSSHVDITNLQIFYPAGTGVGLSANTSGGLRVSHNDFMVGSGSAILLTSVSASTVTGNVMNGITATSIVNVVNSTGDVISSNTINGTATNGIALDATSNGIGGLETNQVGNPALGTITNQLSNLGFSPTTMVAGASAPHYLSAGTIPTVAIKSGAGGGSAAVTMATGATDARGYVNLTSGTTPLANTDLFTVTFAQGYPTASSVVLIGDADGQAAAEFYISAISATQFTVRCKTALTANVAYSLTYVIIG